MADQEILEAVIETDPGPISVWEFSHFLYLFRAVYAAGAERTLKFGFQPYGTELELGKFVGRLRRDLRRLQPSRVYRLASKDLPLDLTIVHINRRNPLELVLGGVGVALAAAVIVSGGEFKFGSLRVKLPPLGTGISALRDAFGRRPLSEKRRRPRSR